MSPQPRAGAASHRIWPAQHGGDACARHFDETDRAHGSDELVDLAGGAGKLEYKALDRGINDSRAEGLGEPQGLVAILPLSRDLDHREFPLDGIAPQCQISDLVDRHEPLQLMADLLDRLRWPGSDDCDARKMLGMGALGDRQALDVIAAAGKQPDDAGENARL